MSYNGDIPRVTAELSNVPLDPMQRRHEIEKSIVASATVLRNRWQKACITSQSGKVYLREVCARVPSFAVKAGKYETVRVYMY